MGLSDFFKQLQPVSWRIRQQAEEQAAEWRAAKQRRAAELLADPAKAKYAARVERGETWSDAHIAYFENPNATATCTHLAPIESAMRQQGVETKINRNQNGVDAKCAIDEAALRTQLPLTKPLRYVTGFMPEKHPEDNPWARLNCSECQTYIELIPQQGRRPDTPIFPAPT